MRVEEQILEQDKLLKLRDKSSQSAYVLLMAAIQLLYAHAGTAQNCGYSSNNWADVIEKSAEQF